MEVFYVKFGLLMTKYSVNGLKYWNSFYGVNETFLEKELATEQHFLNILNGRWILEWIIIIL